MEAFVGRGDGRGILHRRSGAISGRDRTRSGNGVNSPHAFRAAYGWGRPRRFECGVIAHKRNNLPGDDQKFDRRPMARPVARFDFGQGLSVMKIAHVCLPALLLVSFGGCMQIKDGIDSVVIGARNELYAEKAWLDCKSNYNDVEYKCDFGSGFRDGYIAVASGGSTCQPPLPAQKYWHFEYQNPEGQERMLAWFNGYSYGALYAEQEGVSDWSRIVTAPTLPPYRKKRPPRQISSPDADMDLNAPSGDDGSPPDVEPMLPDEPRGPSSASADLIELGEPIDDEGNPAQATAVKWTDGADGY